MLPLGLDFLTFLAATVLVLPVFRSAKISPVLGFLFTGLVLGQLGLFRDIGDIEKLSELGVLFLLFEMGLELSFDRLKALAKFAFGLGGLQMLCGTVAFTAFALPAGNSIGTQILNTLFGAPMELVSIRSFDEAVVIAYALSLSSSAFVLSLLNEKGEMGTKTGSATLGILLFQDIAVVPLLVLLPLLASGSGDGIGTNAVELLQQFGPTVLTTLGWLGLLIVGGRTVLRRVFEMVAESRSDEAFFALCLLTVCGAALLTERAGLSNTLGAFVAGVLLSETSYRTRVEADIEPFKGILLGLFFVTTGSSFDLTLFLQYWPIVLAMVFGLLGVKILIIGLLAPLFGLSRAESIRTAFLLSQGGEFAFVLLALAKDLEILPGELNKLLIMVVVLTMALTPLLNDLGRSMAENMNSSGGKSGEDFEGGRAPTENPIMICGFCELGQIVANMLETAPASVDGGMVPYVAFDLTLPRLEAAQDVGFNVVYGDGSNTKVLRATGVEVPRAIVVVYRARARAVNAVHNLRVCFPEVPIYARALDLTHAAELQAAGATEIVTADTETGLRLGSRLLKDLGASNAELQLLRKLLRQESVSRVSLMAEQMQQEVGKPIVPQRVFRLDQPRQAEAAEYEDQPTPGPSRSNSFSGEGDGAGSAQEEVREALLLTTSTSSLDETSSSAAQDSGSLDSDAGQSWDSSAAPRRGSGDSRDSVALSAAVIAKGKDAGEAGDAHTP